MIRRITAVLAVLALTAGTASAQFLHIGDPNVQLADLTSGGKPNTLSISGLSPIGAYPFDGSTLDVPFTLSGSGATVWLIIYTAGHKAPFTIEGQGPGPYADPEHAAAGWHVYDGVDVLVFKSPGQRFGEGAVDGDRALCRESTQFFCVDHIGLLKVACCPGPRRRGRSPAAWRRGRRSRSNSYRAWARGSALSRGCRR